MRNIWTIARRELHLYFISPIAYLIAFVILLTTGLFFGLNIFIGYTLDASDVTGNLPILFVFTLPALTMRLLADEHRMGTLELLLTAPVRDAELVIGKWLGAFLFVLIIIAATLIFPIILNQIVDPGIDQGLMIATYLGVILLAAAFLAVGVAASAMFNNPMAAFFVTLSAILVLYFFIGWPSSLPIAGSEVFEYLSMSTHIVNNFNRGIIALSDVVYFLSITALGLFLGTAATEMRRWR